MSFLFKEEYGKPFSRGGLSPNHPESFPCAVGPWGNTVPEVMATDQMHFKADLSSLF